MKKLLLLFFLGLSVSAQAQFNSSDQVFCYEYAYTMEDGIKSQKNNNLLIFVNFQNNMIGYVYASKDNVASKSVSYYENEARNMLAKHYHEWNSSPANIYSQADIYSYDSSNSTSSKYTYRRKTKFAAADYTPYGTNVYWRSATDNANCFTFTSDRKEFCLWFIGTPQNVVNWDFGPQNYKARDYYRLIDANKFQPNVDDLW